jgi:hypothetical protein
VTVWTDARLEAALAGLADELDVPDHPLEVRRPAGPRTGRVLAAAAAVVLVVALVVAALPAGRRAVAGWLGLGRVRVERVDPDLVVPTVVFADDVTPVDVDVALADSGIPTSAFDAAGLGRPERAGRPPEGGVVLSWDGGATTLWVRRAAEGGDGDIVKKLLVEAEAEPVPAIGDAALLIEGDHVLSTPARTVAADRVLWWILDDVEHRLESDRDRGALLVIGRTLAG